MNISFRVNSFSFSLGSSGFAAFGLGFEGDCASSTLFFNKPLNYSPLIDLLEIADLTDF